MFYLVPPSLHSLDVAPSLTPQAKLFNFPRWSHSSYFPFSLVEDSRCREMQCDQVCLTFLDSQVPECHCREGHSLGPDGRSCRDINECEETRSRCPRGSICVNLDGGFFCTCPPGQELAANGSCVGESHLNEPKCSVKGQ